MITKAKPDAPASRKKRRPRIAMDDEQTPEVDSPKRIYEFTWIRSIQTLEK
jgi:hypothetical protein